MRHVTPLLCHVQAVASRNKCIIGCAMSEKLTLLTPLDLNVENFNTMLSIGIPSFEELLYLCFMYF